MTTLLQQLTLSEVSGVDDPAHELPGWLVAKARGNEDAVIKEFRALVDEIAASSLTDDEKIAKVKQALALAPQFVRDEMETEALIRKWLVQKARENGHVIEDDEMPVAAAPATKSTGGGLHLPWRHTGASFFRR